MKSIFAFLMLALVGTAASAQSRCVALAVSPAQGTAYYNRLVAPNEYQAQLIALNTCKKRTNNGHCAITGWSCNQYMVVARATIALTTGENQTLYRIGYAKDLTTARDAALLNCTLAVDSHAGGLKPVKACHIFVRLR